MGDHGGAICHAIMHCYPYSTTKHSARKYVSAFAAAAHQRAALARPGACHRQPSRRRGGGGRRLLGRWRCARRCLGCDMCGTPRSSTGPQGPARRRISTLTGVTGLGWPPRRCERPGQIGTQALARRHPSQPGFASARRGTDWPTEIGRDARAPGQADRVWTLPTN